MKSKFTLYYVIAYITIIDVYAQVSPLLSTTWNQGCYYNAQCPTTSSGGACGRVWTGCNATAMAQILKYYNYPSSGMGSHCNTNAPAHCVDFYNETYNYAVMPNNVTSSNAEVAKLMYHLGIAANMQWSGSSSNSFFDSQPLKKYFKYSPRMYSTATFMFNTTQELIDAIKAELNEGRPVYAKGGSHFYLIDGYNASNQFHMNFGWGGTYDGYYNINSVVNGAGTFTPTNFLFNIRPLSGDLETATDTITIAAAASNSNNIEFTSLQSWTMSTNVSWINLNLTSGSSGYYAFNTGSYFNSTTNNGGVRFGYIYIQNGNDTDTIVVKQDASPLAVSPSLLSYNETGGPQNISLNYYSWGTWTASSSDSWINVSPASGTGNATITVTCSNNPNPTVRNGVIIINAGVFSDTVLVEQSGTITTAIKEDEVLKIKLYPNPAQNDITITNLADEPALVEIFSINGQQVLSEAINQKSKIIDISSLENGIYILQMKQGEKKHITKFTIIR
jgi:hypothetical protein